MKIVRVFPGSATSYPIFIQSGHLDASASRIKKVLLEDRLFIITNPFLKKKYQKTLDPIFKDYFHPIWLTIPDGETAKKLNTCEHLLTLLSQNKATRSSTLLSFGGGVIGDITGFVASIYMRGIPYLHMPTTLLAQVDSAIGGKTGVDLKTGKNLVGSFYQPKAVLIHTDFLKTLPLREMQCGLAEVIKYALIFDVSFFDLLARHVVSILKGHPPLLEKIITRCCAFKAKIVSQDERESSVRALLNFGHTLGHAIETLKGFQNIKHGEAISIGMLYATQLSAHLGFCNTSCIHRVKELLCAAYLPTKLPPFSKERYAQVLSRDKKSGLKNLRFILLKKIGKAVIVPLSVKEILSLL